MRLIYLLFACGLIVGACQSTENDSPDEPQGKDSTALVDEPPTPEGKMPTQVEFPSLDSLMITGNLYHVHDTASTILLCHQARYNKYEYDSIALVLHEQGFNCLAIDQRSGGTMDETFENETYKRAQTANLATDYLDAEQDIKAAINYLSERYQQPIILWGSSYSSTLAFYLAKDNPQVKAVVSFSPGNYFADQKGDLVSLIANFDKPFWVTSSKEEAAGIEELLAKRSLSQNQIHFVPKVEGKHGSKALWTRHEGHEAYWASLNAFLNEF